MVLKSEFLNTKQFIFTQTSLRPEESSHLCSSVLGNLLSLTFLADGMDLFGCLDWESSPRIFEGHHHTRGHWTSGELCQFTYLANLCMNHVHTSNLIPVSAQCSGNRQMARNSSKFTTNTAMWQGWRWGTLEETTTNFAVKLSLYHCRILLTDSHSWEKSI